MYGNSRKLIDVTNKFKKLFLKNNLIKISYKVNLKRVFGNRNNGITNFLIILTKKNCKLITDTDNYLNNIIIKL